MSKTRRVVLLSLVFAIGVSVHASDGPIGFDREIASWPELPATPGGTAVSGEASPWTRLSPWASERIAPWGEKVVISFAGGRGLWLYDAGEWTPLTPANPSLMLVWCDRLFAAFPEGGGFWRYHPLVGWERLSVSEPLRLVPTGTKFIADFGAEGLWEYDCLDAPLSPPVYLRLDALETPAVTGTIQGSGTCSENPSIPCTSDFVCASAQPPAGFCENIPCVRTINEWTATLSNVPRNSTGSTTSPFNDIILDRLLITYDPALSGVSSATIGLGGVAIPADSSATVSFAPIPFQALQDIPIDASVTTNLTMYFEGHTPANAEIPGGPSSAQLFIEQCFGEE